MGPFADSEPQFYAINVLKLNLKQLGEKLKQQVQLIKEYQTNILKFCKNGIRICHNLAKLPKLPKLAICVQIL